MRVAIVTGEFPRLSETFLALRVLGLIRRGWDVHVVCWWSREDQWEHFPRLHALRDRVHSRQVVLSELNRAHHFSTLEEPLIALMPDLVHFEFGPLALRHTYVKQLVNCAVVVGFQGYDVNYAGLDRGPGYFNEVWQEADGLHFSSHDLWLRAQRRGCPPDKLHAVVPPVVDLELFDPGERSHTEAVGSDYRPLRLLTVGRLHWKKGLEYGLLAVRLLMDRGISCELRLVGDGEFGDAVRHASRELGLSRAVRLLGAREPDDVRAEMLRADVMLLPTVSEGFSCVVLEAQAMRLPVVATDADGLRENLLPGQTGYVVPRRDPEALADRLETLARDPRLRDRMGRAGRERALALFTPERQLAGFEELYRRAMDRRRSRK